MDIKNSGVSDDSRNDWFNRNQQNRLLCRILANYAWIYIINSQ